jgi:SAM-dependent methyltransferase
MREYYAQRAASYEAIYQKPERQADLAQLQEWVGDALSGHKVLEIACGTGYWTERYAALADTVFATDYNDAMLEIARSKSYGDAHIEFAPADAFAVPAGDYTACFAGFLWSHIKREEQTRLLNSLISRTAKNCQLILIDNNYVEGSSTPVARTDAEGNTYQIRTQEDGSRVEIIKNFPSDSAIRKKLGTLAKDVRVQRNTYFWMATCMFR